MAGPKGQPYVHNTYGWPEGPAIISRDSYLGRRPSLFLQDCTIALKIIPYKCTFVTQRYHIYLVDKNKFCDVKSNLNLYAPILISSDL